MTTYAMLSAKYTTTRRRRKMRKAFETPFVMAASIFEFIAKKTAGVRPEVEGIKRLENENLKRIREERVLGGKGVWIVLIRISMLLPKHWFRRGVRPPWYKSYRASLPSKHC